MQPTCCYVPDPKYSFLFAPDPVQLQCTICTDSDLFLSWARQRNKDNDPALLPCGHVFGLKCLNYWLQTQDTCPICRFELRYELCKHPINPRRLTRENVLFVPSTLPEGGTVGMQCSQCQRETDQRVATDLCMQLAGRYYERKERYDQTGWEADWKKMTQAAEDLDRVKAALTPPEDRQW